MAVAGTKVGMKSKLPSFSGGMNSLPMPAVSRCSGGANPSRRLIGRGNPKATMAASSQKQAAARARTVLRRRNAKSSAGS